MKKQEIKTDLQKLVTIRNQVVKLGEEIDFTSKVKQDLTLKLLNIQHNCDHDMVVRFKNNETGREIRCLYCNKSFYGNIVGADFYFKNIIDLQPLEADGDKVILALQLFEQEKALNPNLSDKKIIEIINKKIKENKISMEQSSFVKTIRTKI